MKPTTGQLPPREPGPHGITLDMLAIAGPTREYLVQHKTKEITRKRGSKGPVVQLVKDGDWVPFVNLDRDARRAAKR